MRAKGFVGPKERGQPRKPFLRRLLQKLSRRVFPGEPMICSVCEQPVDEFRQVDGVCITCIEDSENLPDELICSDFGVDYGELETTTEGLDPDSPQDRLGD